MNKLLLPFILIARGDAADRDGEGVDGGGGAGLVSYYVERKKEQVLPRHFLDYISGTLNDYKEVMETVSAQEFKTRYANALRIKDRVRIEAR